MAAAKIKTCVHEGEELAAVDDSDSLCPFHRGKCSARNPSAREIIIYRDLPYGIRTGSVHIREALRHYESEELSRIETSAMICFCKAWRISCKRFQRSGTNSAVNP